MNRWDYLGMSNGTFYVDHAMIDMAIKGTKKIEDFPKGAQGFNVKYEKDSGETCQDSCIRLVQVIGWEGGGKNVKAEVDDGKGGPGTDKDGDIDLTSTPYMSQNKHPILPGAAPRHREEAANMPAYFDAPIKGGFHPDGRGHSKGTWVIEVCAFCLAGGRNDILGCARFDYYSEPSKGDLLPKQGGATKDSAGNLVLPAYLPASDMFRTAYDSWTSEYEENTGTPW